MICFARRAPARQNSTWSGCASFWEGLLLEQFVSPSQPSLNMSGENHAADNQVVLMYLVKKIGVDWQQHMIDSWLVFCAVESPEF